MRYYVEREGNRMLERKLERQREEEQRMKETERLRGELRG